MRSGYGKKTLITAAMTAMAAMALASCSSDNAYQGAPDVSGAEVARDSILSRDGMDVNLFRNSPGDGTEGAVAVNAFLWRASLDTISFMPLSSADPFGGIIISDWYAPPETAEERFKVNIYILGRALRADGLKVSVFRQTRDQVGRWDDAPVGAEVASEFEDAVLTRARELRLQAVAEPG